MRAVCLCGHMTRYGFHASHEQVPARQLLADVQRAERAGFEVAMCSDHFSAWSRRQGQSGFAWSWLGAALATTELTFGCVNAPGQSYHPAIVSQAIATLGSMFPGRFWVALGSGESTNEHITGDAWPRKEVRTQTRRCAWRGSHGRNWGRTWQMTPSSSVTTPTAARPRTASTSSPS